MIVEYQGKRPVVGKNTFLAPNSTVIGDCRIGEDCGIWFNAVIRADVSSVDIGKNTNIQDGCVIHCDHGYPVRIGYGVTVGHNAILHGCTIGDSCIIGMGSTILDGASIGKNSIVGANSLVTSGKSFPENSLIMGSPARAVRTLSEQETASIKQSAHGYVDLKEAYK